MKYIFDLDRMKQMMGINENKSGAEKFLRDNNIPTNQPEYTKLKEILTKDNAIGYLSLFTKWLFAQKEPTITINKILNLYNEIKNDRNITKTLKKPLESFTNVDKAMDEISNALNTNKIKRFIIKHVSNKALKNEFLNNLDTNESIREMLSITERFEELTPQQQNVFLKKSAKYKTTDEWITAIEKHIQIVSEGFYYEDVVERLNKMNHDVKIIYEDPQKEWLLVNIKTFEASKEFGTTTSWCITKEKVYWDQYLEEEGNKQYFFFDFTNDDYNKQVIGITMDSDNNVTASHLRDDSDFKNMASSYLDSRKVLSKIKILNKREFALSITDDIKKNAPELKDINNYGEYDNWVDYENYIKNRANVVRLNYGQVYENGKLEYKLSPDTDSLNKFYNYYTSTFLGLIMMNNDKMENLDVIMDTYQNLTMYQVYFYDDNKIKKTEQVNIVKYVLNNLTKNIEDIKKYTPWKDDNYGNNKTPKNILKLNNYAKKATPDVVIDAMKQVYVKSNKITPETKRAILHLLNDNGINPLTLSRDRKNRNGEELTDTEFGMAAKQGVNHNPTIMKKINAFRRGENVQLSTQEILYAIDNGYGDFFKQQLTKELNDDPYITIDYDYMTIFQKLGMMPTITKYIINKADNLGYGTEGLNSIELSIYQHGKR